MQTNDTVWLRFFYVYPRRDYQNLFFFCIYILLWAGGNTTDSRIGISTVFVFFPGSNWCYDEVLSDLYMFFYRIGLSGNCNVNHLKCICNFFFRSDWSLPTMLWRMNLMTHMTISLLWIAYRCNVSVPYQ